MNDGTIDRFIERIQSRMPKWNVDLFFMFLLIGIGFGIFLYNSRFSIKQKVVAVILYIYSANVLVVTMLGRELWEISEHMRATFIPFFLRQPDTQVGETMGIWILEYFMNIAMFFPFGFLFSIMFNEKKRYKNAIVLGIILTVVLELTQCISKLGVLELDDIVANTLGTVLGAFLHYKIKKYILNKRGIENEYTRRN